MKLVTFTESSTNGPTPGAVVDDRVVDLPRAFQRARTDPGRAPFETFPGDMRSLIAHGPEAWDFVRELVDTFGGDETAPYTRALEEVTLEAPVNRPSKLVCTGLNFEDYRQQLGLEYLDVPQIFLKAPSSLTGSGQPIQIPEGYGEVYHEWELGCIIGRRCRGLDPSEVEEAIFGYTVFNDITAHDIELMTREYQQWAKSFDTFAPTGPWLVTTDELSDVSDLEMIRRRNGTVESQSSSAEMRHSFNEIVAFASTFMTLEPGDVITSGTPPAGTIESGDTVEGEIERIGTLVNPVESISVNPRYAEAIGL